MKEVAPNVAAEEDIDDLAVDDIQLSVASVLVGRGIRVHALDLVEAKVELGLEEEFASECCQEDSRVAHQMAGGQAACAHALENSTGRPLQSL